jgi:hypothetical protein
MKQLPPLRNQPHLLLNQLHLLLNQLKPLLWNHLLKWLKVDWYADVRNNI